jgi:hypothetical protein
MLKFTKAEAKTISDEYTKKTTNETMRFHYATIVNRDSITLHSFCAKLEGVIAYGYIPSDKVEANYEPAIKATTRDNEAHRDEYKAGAEKAHAALYPYIGHITEEIDAAEKRASVRTLGAEDVLKAIRELQASGKRGDTKTLTTYEKMPKSYKYQQSFTVATITRRKSDGAITVEVKRETSW